MNHGSHAIRGLRSAASLKPEPRGGGHAAVRRDPRTQIRGLIEASGRPRHQSTRRGDPRTQIRGLIEAGRFRASIREAAVPIRGLRSAASLKRHIPDQRDHHHPVPIRGLRSAASLKRAIRAVYPKQRVIDPRTQIRGLIEASQSTKPPAWHDATDPRTQIRGLIEAPANPPYVPPGRGPIRGLRSAASLKQPAADPASGAASGDPRTQIRGLIEASLATPRTATGRDAIRGLRSAASLKLVV